MVPKEDEMPKIVLVLVALVLVVGLVAACPPATGDPVTPPPADDPPADDPPADDPPSDDPPGVEWEADGVITPGEYTGVQIYGNYEIHWASDEEYIYVGMRAKIGGWVSVGFDATPGAGMADVDMVLGVVNGDEVTVSDEFGTGPTTHRPDTELGGTDDILEFGGVEQGGWTTIEFKRALDTGDPYDAVLTGGTITIIWAYSSSKSLTAYHSANRGYGEITL
jgi:hypothetical protein